MANVTGKSSEDGTPGVLGESEKFNGVLGITTADGHAGVAGVCDQGKSDGVYGRSKAANGVIGFSSADGSSGVAGVNDDGNGVGVYGRSARAAGVQGESKSFNGVLGITTADGHAGVAGVCDQGKSNGVYGRSKSANGVIGFSSADGSSGVAGANDEGNGFGVYGRSARAAGVQGESKEGNGVAGISTSGMGVYGKGGRLAGFFEGDVEVTGDIRLTNADCAEDFDIAETAIAEPGTVMVLNEIGALQPSQHAYDKRVAGVVSGAGEYKPGIVLDKRETGNMRRPIALLGKVFCRVDATLVPIEVGDLLTTSLVPGHAMKAKDPMEAFGAVIGKALRPLRDGKGLIPILIALQ